MDDLEAKLDLLKKLNWSTASVSFFVVKRKLILREAKYEVLHVNVNKDLARRLRDNVANKIDRSNTALEYDFNTADLDDDLLGLPTEDTDMQRIIDTLQGETGPPTVDQYQNLLGSWMYIARFDLDGQPPLFSARRVPDNWETKKVFQWINMVFQNNMLVSLDEQQVFRIDGKIDFFAYEATLFIVDKKNFETALNFREGMERNRDEIVKEFSNLGLFEDADAVSKLVGNNLHRLRRLSQSLFLKSSGGDFRRHTWSLAPSDPSHHEPTSGQLHPGHRTCHSPLYVLGKTTAASHPREGSLHYPTT